MSPLTEPTKLTLAKTYVGIDDPDAADYIAAVEAADEAASPGVGALETATKVAIHSFVKGCKADGIWPAIKASCILAGARTLEGALVPLAGTAPNKFGTAANWNYNRKTGLQGDGSTNYLDSGRAGNSQPQNSVHLAVYGTSLAAGVHIGALSAGALNRLTLQYVNTTSLYTQLNIAGNYNATHPAFSAGFMAGARDSSTAVTTRAGGSTVTGSIASVAAPSSNCFVFARNFGGASSFTASRLAFYSIGEALDLALLDTRVTDLITAFGVAIP